MGKTLRGQQPALLEDFLMRFSFVVRTGFVLKPVRKVRDTAARKLNRGRKRKRSPLKLIDIARFLV